MAKSNAQALFISATRKENIEDFKKELYEKVKEIHSKRFPYNSYLYNTEWEIGKQ